MVLAGMTALPMSEETQSGLYPIRTVAHLTGVNAITLRAWETRYGIVKPQRKASGHRLYNQDQVDRIHRVVALLDRGMRISEVRAYFEREHSGRRASAETASHSGGDRDPWRRLMNGMLAAIVRFDEEALEAVHNEALSQYRIQEVTRRLVSPLLVELGRRWSSGEGSIAEEHFFGFYLRNTLGARFHHRGRSGRGPRLLMACVPGERHEIGLLLLALGVNDAGYRPIILGADMPLEELALAADKTGCAAIVLSGLMELSDEMLKDKLPALAAAAAVPVVMGGNASVDYLDALRRCGIESLGADMDTGLARLEKLVPLTS